MSNADAAALDLEALRERYRIEREKRLRPDGNAQYADLTGRYADFDRDPYVEPGFTRDPIVEETDVVIVGAGFGGMLAAANLRKAGIERFRILDKAGDFGGTWYWNRYPGCMCDVESYVYLPMLEETGYMPTEKYASAPEIFSYCQLLGRTFDLYSAALFQTEIRDAAWDDAARRWVVTTTRDDRLSAKFVVIAGGVLNHAKLPGIPGIETFAGHQFHTSRWDYGYTGGGPFERMANLADKRVGIIGTGATAVQVVPRLAESAKEVYVFQRTPAAVGVRNQMPTDPEWFASLEPGWQAERIRNFTQMVTGAQPEIDLVQDSWTSLLYFDTKKSPGSEDEAAELERIDFENMNAMRARIDAIVEDPQTAQKLKPWYGQNCKRPCFHDEYLPAFNEPNVHLVDTEGKGVELINEHGPVVDGVEYPVDVLVYASGFEVTTDYAHRLGFDPHGRAGVPMSDAWADGAHTLHGVVTRGFPNLLMISTVQGGFGVNFVHYLTETSAHVAHIIDRCVREGIAEIEPTEEAQEAWFMRLMTMIDGLARYNATCTPGYLNNEQAEGDMKAARNTPFMGSVIDYADCLKQWREDGTFEGVEVTRAG
ncbi:MAG: NAD(P)/FAD-dependent oxidoreductase [Acidimicrobiia bacterium]|jgi:cation diffusion facilitator CzcD-associated flavoprotein CzcO